MLSAFPATVYGDPFAGNHFAPFQPGFPPWEYHEPSFLFHPQEEPVVLNQRFSQEPTGSNYGLDCQNPSPRTGSNGTEPKREESKPLHSGSSASNPINNTKKPPGSDETSRLGCIVDETKKRRRISNRESARRSRMRKQRHLENLRNQANRLKVGNRDQMNRLHFVVRQTQSICGENVSLRAEAALLRQRLWDLRQVLVVRQLQQLYPTSMH